MGIEVRMYQVVCGKGDGTGKSVMPNASVEVMVDGEIRREAAVGDTAINALYGAMNRATGHTVDLRKLDIATQGGHNIVQPTVSHDGKEFVGRGQSPDVIEAALIGYLDALNQFPQYQPRNDEWAV